MEELQTAWQQINILNRQAFWNGETPQAKRCHV